MQSRHVVCLSKCGDMMKQQIEMKSNNEQMANTMSKSGFTFYTALHELLDNAIVTAKNIRVELLVENDGMRAIHYISVIDDGDGIGMDELAEAFAVGARTNQGINEHGVGMKSAIAYFGNMNIADGLDYILTYDGVDCFKVEGYEGNTLHIDTGLTPPWSHTGTHISMSVRLNVFAASRINALKESLGVRYGNFLLNGGTITIQEFDIATDEPILNAKEEAEVVRVTPIHPPYFHPTTGTKVHLLKKEIVTQNIVADFIIGMSAEDEEGTWKPLSYGGGIDIVQNDRVVVHRSYEPLTEWRPKNHTSLNRLIGQLIVKDGHIPTTPKKDNVQQTEEWQAIKEAIAAAILEHKITAFFNPPENDNEYDNLSESLIRDGLAACLTESTLPTGEPVWSDVKTEESTDTNLSMDVTAMNGEDMYVFEVKKGNFNAQDMNQLIGYMVTVGAERGVVFAKTVLANAKKQFDEHWQPLLGEDFTIAYADKDSQLYKTVMGAYVKVGE